MIDLYYQGTNDKTSWLPERKQRGTLKDLFSFTPWHQMHVPRTVMKVQRWDNTIYLLPMPACPCICLLASSPGWERVASVQGSLRRTGSVGWFLWRQEPRDNLLKPSPRGTCSAWASDTWASWRRAQLQLLQRNKIDLVIRTVQQPLARNEASLIYG